MSKTIKHIISCLLIGILFIPGLSSFIAEDADFDREIDLKDAIINLQKLDRISDKISNKCNTKHSKNALQTTVNTIKAVAGLKKIFIPQEDDGISNSAEFYPLIATFELNNLSVFYENILETTSLYSSILIAPPSPPPLNSSNNPFACFAG
jgi:hypothetical protein